MEAYTVGEGCLEVATRVDDDGVGLDNRNRREEQTEYHHEHKECDLCTDMRWAYVRRRRELLSRPVLQRHSTTPSIPMWLHGIGDANMEVR